MKYFFLVFILLISCETNQHAVNHMVFIELVDTSNVEAMIKDSDARLATIPTVRDYFCGTHVPSGRTAVLTDYDVGIYFAFDSLEEYQLYVNHPSHVSFVNDWKPKLKSLRVYDISD